MENKKLFVVVHTHRFGTSTYMVRSMMYPRVNVVVEKCEIDFEPDEPDFDPCDRD